MNELIETAKSKLNYLSGVPSGIGANYYFVARLMSQVSGNPRMVVGEKGLKEVEEFPSKWERICAGRKKEMHKLWKRRRRRITIQS